jgi:hypothetical protein
MHIIPNGPWWVSAFLLDIVRTAAGGTMFLLLPGLLRILAFVRHVLRRDSEPEQLVEAR